MPRNGSRGSSRNGERGFTLIEILVVLLIILVLAAIAFPLFINQRTKAQDAEAKTALRNRLMRTLGRHLTTLGPFLTGAVAGGALNRVATRKMAQAVRQDLRRQRALPPA